MRNSRDQETAPIAAPRNGSASNMFRSFGSLFGSSAGSEIARPMTPQSSDGYVEFGMQDPERSGRTLGTFAGVFSPVALSMFSALVFIRVGGCDVISDYSVSLSLSLSNNFIIYFACRLHCG